MRSGWQCGGWAVKSGWGIACAAAASAPIAANRVRGVCAALCTSEEMAVLSRKHNDANVLVLGGRITACR